MQINYPLNHIYNVIKLIALYYLRQISINTHTHTHIYLHTLYISVIVCACMCVYIYTDI